ncbi:MAG: M3 family peptidase [Thiothrix sp.]|nr:MAG: M3 family peptidase [Thiothrix sp.]
MHNPLLQTNGLPQFTAIQAEHVEPALEQVLQENREWLVRRLAVPVQPTWDNLIYPLDEAGDRLERVWSPVSHLNAVANTESLRTAYNACLPKLSDYHTEMGQNQALYEAVKAVAGYQQDLEPSQQHALERSLLSFRLSGVALAEDKKQRYREISQQLSSLSSKFSDNILDATNAWFKQISDPELLKGIPESGLEMAQQAAQQRQLEGWVFTLDFPSYYSVLAYADSRELRAELYRAYTTRASDLGANAAWDNTQTMRDILSLRQEEAELLGFANYAEVSLAMKMADTTQEVVDFLEDLAKRSKPFAAMEFAEVKAFAQTQLGLTDVQAWDVTYISEKMKEARFDFTDEDLKPYFPVNKVIRGLFSLVERLYGIRIQQSTEVDVWHPDVTFYQVYEADGSLRAEFYLDLYARQHKRGGAWMSDYCGRFRRKDGLQIPVAFMTCNGTPPVGDKPALFTHDEVVTLFHEFGHGLHHMLTKVDYPDIAGINGVEWDAVELPSQFMENWCWEPEVLNMIAGHWQTGEPLPEDLFNKMQAARHFQTAMMMVRQLEFALFDMRLHMDPKAAEPGRLEQIQAEVREQVAVIQPPVFNRMAHSFSHIFAGGYAAGYYSYKWAEVLSADAYARFEEAGLFSAEVGQAFLEEILQVGGSRPAMESFVAFRGRKPQIDALLRHSGLVKAA